MIDPPEIVRTQARLSASIRLMIRRRAIHQVMGPALQELRSTLAAQGVQPAGPWYTHHFRAIPDFWDFEVCLPVGSPVQEAGRVCPSEWPAMEVARTVYHGGYGDLAGGWREFQDWMDAQGLRTEPGFYECYLAGPEAGSDPDQWRTELTKPLAADR